MIELSISCNDCGELAAKVSNIHSQMPFLAAPRRAGAQDKEDAIEHHSVNEDGHASSPPLQAAGGDDQPFAIRQIEQRYQSLHLVAFSHFASSHITGLSTDPRQKALQPRPPVVFCE